MLGAGSQGCDKTNCQARAARTAQVDCGDDGGEAGRASRGF